MRGQTIVSGVTSPYAGAVVDEEAAAIPPRRATGVNLIGNANSAEHKVLETYQLIDNAPVAVL